MLMLFAAALLLHPAPDQSVSAGAQPATQVAPVQVAPLTDEPISVPTIAYPADAKQAHITGTVELRVSVDTNGQVTSVQAVDGPQELRQAAVDAYSRARYRPLIRDGRPTPAVISTKVNFSLTEAPPDTDELVDKQFQPLHHNCQVLSLGVGPGQTTPEKKQEALSVCRQAVALAQHFSPRAELDARATAYNDLVLLLISSGKYDGSGKAVKNPDLPEAGVLADQAIDLVTQSLSGQPGFIAPHTPAVATAYITRAEVRSLAGNLKGSAEDCAQAEEVLSNLVADQAAPNQKKIDKTANYRGQLHETYLLHAIVLERQHKSIEAKRIRLKADAT